MGEARTKASLAKAAAPALAAASRGQRERALLLAAESVRSRADQILEANARDLARAREAGMSAPLQDRLLLDDARLCAIAGSLEDIARQDDPLGRVVGGSTLGNGLRIDKVTVPLGVVAMVYEARPNVTADAFGLCVRSGNACVLKGGSAARESCLAIVGACREALREAGLPEDALQYVDDDAVHAQTAELLEATGLVDVLIPRGGAALIRACVEGAKVPVIETGTGNCHVYVHESADLDRARAIVMNAKTQRVGVCNAAESLLVDRAVAPAFLPVMLAELAGAGVLLHCDEESLALAGGLPDGSAVAATERDWGTEYLALEMSVRVVSGLDEAIAHVNRYGTGHSEAIVADSYDACETFLAGVDAAVVYANASTRFTDGGVFGLGAEIGISTQKLHARGPMGAGELTSVKYVVRGSGQVR
ncbi:glutamate-5-semialdehyde dehydrogenase [Olsenella sp. An293]|uniref:glutamate-5-semialdehyde dehydrogenase n=1 Tax=Olsenella sp. An293 TaxID=1965626 RepID=UPI000B3A90EB|nr:glutamate-5-semialdehyde dehydrogenase [Olsenella sp. An293]OUO32694.1 glutamate-5-semialdehyde dehydrogenase [Olsenella sp. An293]